MKDVDIFAITETWLKPDPNDDAIKEVPPTGYKIVSTPRSDGRMGEGIALVFKEHLSISPLAAQEGLTSMEHNAFNLHLQHTTITIHVIYRYPNASTLNFCNELVQIAESTINSGGRKTMFTGDFIIHMDQVDTPDTITFNDVVDSLNLKNFVGFPMHTQQHTLDLMIDERDNPIISSTDKGHLLSDHNFVHAFLKVPQNLPKDKTVTYSKLKSINHTVLDENLNFELQSENLEGMVNSYNLNLRTILDKHALVKTKTVRTEHKQPWCNDMM